MKKIEATIRATKIGAVSDAINDLVGGFSILEGNGRGSGERQTIRAGRGTGSFVAEYNKIAVVITIVDDSKADDVIFAISDAASTGVGGDGIITISDVENVINIASKKTGSESL